MRTKKLEDEISEFHRLVVEGLSNGLSHTSGDEKEKDPEFWKKRSNLFDRFEQCVMSALTKQPYEFELEALKKVAEEGYKTQYD